MKLYELTDEEVREILGAIHMYQDALVESADDLAGREHPDDRAAGRDCDRLVTLLDGVRKKLGDMWEPDPSYRVPDSPLGL